MKGEDVNQGDPYPGSYAAPLGSGDAFGYATTSCLGILSIIHPISVLVLRILTTNLTTRISMDAGKSRSGDFKDLWWDRGKKETETRGFHYGYEFRSNSWTISYWLRYGRQSGTALCRTIAFGIAF
jgi:hypothetical protein